MNPTVRIMNLEEVDLVIDYFHNAVPEYLEMLGVDPTRIPNKVKWKAYYKHALSQPIENRETLLVIWELENKPIGFSTLDKIQFGKEAYMHLHILNPKNRAKGVGHICVKKSAQIYCNLFNLEHLFCEPNAFNVAPNRTLQKAGFKYVKTHKTVPNRLNYHQAVTRWVFQRTKK